MSRVLAVLFCVIMASMIDSGTGETCYECSGETECENPTRTVYCWICMAEYKNGKPQSMNCSTIKLNDVPGEWYGECPPKDPNSKCDCRGEELCNGIKDAALNKEKPCSECASPSSSSATSYWKYHDTNSLALALAIIISISLLLLIMDDWMTLA